VVHDAPLADHHLHGAGVPDFVQRVCTEDGDAGAFAGLDRAQFVRRRSSSAPLRAAASMTSMGVSPASGSGPGS
jgi:hypothetical protein